MQSASSWPVVGSHANRNWIVQTMIKGYDALMVNAEKSPSATERRDSITLPLPQVTFPVFPLKLPVTEFVVTDPYSAISPIVPEMVPAFHVAEYIT